MPLRFGDSRKNSFSFAKHKTIGDNLQEQYDNNIICFYLLLN